MGPASPVEKGERHELTLIYAVFIKFFVVSAYFAVKKCGKRVKNFYENSKIKSIFRL